MAMLTKIRTVTLPAAVVVLLVSARTHPPENRQAISISVIDSLSRQPIVNADVTDLRSGAHLRTDANGQVRIAMPADGSLSIRVRQVGFAAVTRDIRRGGESSTIVMSRIRYLLPAVKTVAASACAPPADSTAAQLSAAVLEQITLAAQRYNAFRRDYPFKAVVQRRTATLKPDWKVTKLVESTGDVHSKDWGDPYRPGEVIQSSGLGFSIPLLFLATLAEPEFWGHHCFSAAAAEGTKLIRLEFEPARDIKSPDWQGTAFIDSATSMLVRVDFRLVGLTRNSRVQRLEGYTTFRSPSPFFVIPDSTVAGWWKRPPANGEWGSPDVVQSLYTVSVEYVKARPP